MKTDKTLNVKVIRYIRANYEECKDVACGMFLPIDESDMNKRILIHYVYHNATEQVLKDFLTVMMNEEEEANVQIKKDGKTALIRAAQDGQVESVKLLLQQKDIDISIRDNNNSTALMHAKREGHQEIVKLLEDFIFTVAADDDVKTLKTLLKNKNVDVNGYGSLCYLENTTLLDFAVSESSHEIIELLLKDSRINVNKKNKDDGTTPLITAIQSRHIDIVKMLLEHKDIDLSICDGSGMNALMHAKKEGRQDIVELLFK